MPFNVMIQLCRVTRASKLFQRNFYLPLLKPLSPKDALRRHIISGKNVLGKRLEHYIPVLEEVLARQQRRKYMIKGLGKKKQRKKSSMRYLMPLMDMDMEFHPDLNRLLMRKSKGKGQCYTYYVPDKDLTLVFSHQMERAIRDRDVTDVTIAQRSEKILVKLANGIKLVMPLLPYDGNAVFYRGEGWTHREIEEYHHHGKETMGLAKLFEAKESGVEEWELEMMRMANKRKKKQRGEGTADWKAMMTQAVDNMDWNKFEEDTKQIVEEQDDFVDDDPIAMEVDDMEKTRNVCEKLMAVGASVLDKLPAMTEIPEIIRVLKDGELTDIANVSGVTVKLPSSGIERFVPGQVVTGDEGEIFMPGQTVEKDDGSQEYTPGFTVLMDGEPALLPGLVMGDDPNKPMFLPGESTITETGELQFTETEDDLKERSLSPAPEPEPEIEEPELDEEQNSEEEQEEMKPPPKREKKEFIYERPKRFENQTTGVKRRERKAKGPLIILQQPADIDESRPKKELIQAVIFDQSVPTFEKEVIQQEKERVEQFTEKKAKEEYSIEKKRREIRKKATEIVAKNPVTPKYEPLDAPEKSSKLKEFEEDIKKGDFFGVDHRKFLSRELGRRRQRGSWLSDPYQYQNTFDSVGINRHKVWKSVY